MAEVFQRLIGLETEYAIRFQPDDPEARPPGKFQLYESLRTAVGKRVLSVPAKHFKEGVFTANGGAIWFEAERPSAGGGLIEGATPECRGPHELLAYQRAQDQLLADSAARSSLPGQFRLIKNDRDSLDNIYGAQENYEATLAEGLSLFLWRAGLVVLFPLAILTWIGILISVLVTLSYFAIAGIFYLPIRLATGGKRSLALLLFGEDLVEGRESCVHVPAWLESTLQFVTRLLTAPLALALYVQLSAVAFRAQRDQMLAFLASRSIFCGAGLVDSNGEFQLSDKGPSVNCQLGFGGMLFDRPIFSMGHFFKEIYAESWFSPRQYFGLFAGRQRLQIALGDSNMCETAELLRIGTTLLVLDAAESGALAGAPRLRRPIDALRRICGDPALAERVSLRRGGAASALELQRFYHGRCAAFLEENEAAPPEAWDILHLWKRTLDALDDHAAGAAAADSLVGSVDWVTKKYFLDHAASDAVWSERKKIDICYHELSDDGYYRMLANSGLVSNWADPDAIERAIRTPPANSPATTRGRYIREFACSDTPITANWKSVVLGGNWDSRVIRIADYGHASSERRHGTRPTQPRKPA